MLTQNLPDFWENLYSEGKDYWNLKKATPALEEFFKHPSCPKTGSVLVPGAGYGYDAEAWAKRGHDVLAVDLFELSPKNPKKGGMQFDIIYDYCTFSAIHPGRRDECLEIWQKMLKDDGVVIAFFYPLMNGNTLQGPPHCTTEGELAARLGGIFDVAERITPTASLPSRKGKEQIWLLKKCL